MRVSRPQTTHSVTLAQLQRWCDGVAVCPNDVLKRTRVKALLAVLMNGAEVIRRYKQCHGGDHPFVKRVKRRRCSCTVRFVRSVCDVEIRSSSAWISRGRTFSSPQSSQILSDSHACAEETLAAYKQSNDKDAICLRCHISGDVYHQHQHLNDELLEILRSGGRAIDSRTASPPSVEREKLWNDLAKAVTLSALGLMDQKRTGPNGTLNAILLTKAERQRLSQKIASDFPGLKLKQPNAPTPVKLAGLYYSFLSRPIEVRERVSLDEYAPSPIDRRLADARYKRTFAVSHEYVEQILWEALCRIA